MDNALGPRERHCVLVPRSSEPVDGLADLSRVSGAHVPEHRSRQDAEPDLDLVQPGRMSRRVVEVHLSLGPLTVPVVLAANNGIVADVRGCRYHHRRQGPRVLWTPAVLYGECRLTLTCISQIKLIPLNIGPSEYREL